MKLKNRKINLRATAYALRTKGGFTLIEILIVVSIIGLLASIIFVGLGSSRARGRDARRIADLSSIKTGLELYFSKNGRYRRSKSAERSVNAKRLRLFKKWFGEYVFACRGHRSGRRRRDLCKQCQARRFFI